MQLCERVGRTRDQVLLSAARHALWRRERRSGGRYHVLRLIRGGRCEHSGLGVERPHCASRAEDHAAVDGRVVAQRY
eukprot:scaffold9901_cov65-Phaeocystis_antarctica.AAC.6